MWSDFCEDNRFLKAEFQAILVHKYYLSEKAGYDVGMGAAIADWQEKHAAAWRHARLRRELKEQLREIEQHKWIESEKAGRDLGDQAVIDWVQRYAERWRRHWEEQEAYE